MDLQKFGFGLYLRQICRSSDLENLHLRQFSYGLYLEIYLDSFLHPILSTQTRRQSEQFRNEKYSEKITSVCRIPLCLTGNSLPCANNLQWDYSGTKLLQECEVENFKLFWLALWKAGTRNFFKIKIQRKNKISSDGRGC